ncbi:MAG: SpoIIE family protein phosphatase [Candidatus Promineofilum sp.]|nr:SpoIIE family protein phosphatase [Promineifilum sp.]MCW5864792.1 SpoIIE family protein phosphatase [Anaerolineae bacterium]
MTIRIIIADDHSVVRQGLRMFLGLDPELEVVGEAVNGAEAVQKAEALQPDVVLMDLIMPVMSGLEATAEIRRRGLSTQVIVVTSVIEEAAVTAVIRAGAIGYLLKDTEADELRRAIKAAAAGRAQLSPAIAARLLAETQNSDADTLTARENEVLRLAAAGLSDQEIALRLLVSEPVVHSHVAGIVEKLRLANQSQTLLLDFANRAQTYLDPAALLDFLVTEVPRLLQADAAALLLPEPGDGRLALRAAHNWPSGPLSEMLGAGALNAFESRQPWQNGGGDETGPLASVVFIPLLIGGGAIGVLGLGGRQPRRLNEDDLRFARLLANQAALSVEQARLHRVESRGQRMERELQQARQIQMSLLPGGYPQVAGYDFAAAYESAREIGGDLYDFIEWPADPHRVGLLIADVSGKGTAAALFMAHSRAMIRGAAQTQPGPAATLAAANVQIARDNHAMLFVSAFYAVMDAPSGRLTFANAGHNVPIVRRADGRVEEAVARGMVLGIMDDMTYDEATTTLAEGDMIVLYTDGITEAMNARGDLFDKERLMAAVHGASPADARALIDAILAAVRDFTGDTPQADDLTIVTVRRISK